MTLRQDTVRRAAAAVVALAAAAVAAPSPAQIPIKIGAPTIRDNNEFYMNTFKAEVEKATAGRYRVDAYPGGQLGSMPRSIEGVILGTIEITITIPEFMGGLDKRFGVISMPGVFDSPMHAFRTVQEPEFKQAYWTLAEPKGVKFAGMYCPTDTNYVFRSPIKSLGDFKGKKIRTFPSAIEREILAVLGAAPASMSLEEVLPALQQGTIDASKSGMTVFTTFKYQASARYVIRTNETMICTPVIASKLWFDKLPGDVQQAVLAAARIADEKAQDFSTGFNENAYVEWEKGGGVLIRLSAAERADMMKRLRGVGTAALKDDPASQATFEVMRRVAERVRPR
jgi:TRAP-type C4-dicarboxylate transport system substrate-binding protein